VQYSKHDNELYERWGLCVAVALGAIVMPALLFVVSLHH